MNMAKRLDLQAILERAPSRRVLLVTGAAILGLAVLGLGGWLWHTVSESRGLAAYADALARAEAGQAPDAPPAARVQAIRELEAVLAEYPSSAAAPDAAHQLGNLRYSSREYPAARRAYEVAVAGGATGTIRALAASGIAYTWEAERQFRQAAEAFGRAGERITPGHFLYEDVQMGLARNQEASDQKDAAIETYRKIIKEVPKSRAAELARARLLALGAPAGS
jgi:tetratricopeptide (TPR) repeat protein